MKKVHAKQKGILFGLFAVFGLFLIGCQVDSDGTVTLKEGLASNPVTISGTVIDQETRQGIGKAEVYIKVFGEWRKTKTDASEVIGEAGGAGDSTTGDFKFDNLPVSTDDIPILIKSPEGSSYLQFTDVFDTPDFDNDVDGINVRISEDLGQVEMEQGVTATVRVVDSATGSYVVMDKDSDSSTVEAIPIYNGFGGIGSFVSIEDVVATQDSTDSDKYTIVVPQTGATTLTVPNLDVDGDGLYDYTGGATTITTEDGIVTGSGELNTVVVVTPLQNGTTLALLADNINQAGAGMGGTTLNMIGASDPIKLFFNIPLAVAGEDNLTLTFEDDFKKLTAAAVRTEVAVTATTSNSLLTITPASALVEGMDYDIEGSVRSDVDGTTGPFDDVFDLDGFVADPIYVSQTGTGTIGSTPIVTIDNFNFWTNGAVITSADPLAEANGTPFAVFPEPVWGDIREISRTAGTTTTVSNGAPVNITGQTVNFFIRIASNDADIAFNNGSADEPFSGSNRADQTKGFRFSLGGATVPDHQSGTASQIEIGVVAVDGDGNVYDVENNFNVE